MIIYRGTASPEIPRYRLYRYMLEASFSCDMTECRVGVYQPNWNPHFSTKPQWFWWCPGCQNRQSKVGWKQFPVKVQGWGNPWIKTMQDAWDHVKDAAQYGSYDERMDLH